MRDSVVCRSLLACALARLRTACVARPSQPVQSSGTATPLPLAVAAMPFVSSSPVVTTSTAPTRSTSAPAHPSTAQQALFLGPDGKLQAATTTNREIARITTLPADAHALALSPNGGSLAFIQAGQLLVRALDTSTDTRVISATVAVGDLTFAPDGHSLLYSIDTSADPVNQPQPQLYLSQLDGQPAPRFGPGFAPA